MRIASATLGICLAGALLTGMADAQQPVAGDATGTIRVGLIGLDTSHAGAFTQLLNDPSRADHVPGARVVAAVKGGSPDVEASANRIEKFTADLRDTWKIMAFMEAADLSKARKGAPVAIEAVLRAR